MAGDRSAVRVVRGHPWTQTTLSEVARTFSTPVSAVSSAVDRFRSTRASRGSLGPTSWNWEVWSVWATRPSTVLSRSCNLCRTSASGAVGSSVGSSRGCWTRSHHASDGLKRAKPDAFVRAVRHQSTTAFDGGRLGEDPFSFRIGRRPESSCNCSSLDELKAIPDSLWDLSSMIEVKTRELTNVLSQHDGEKVASVLATIGNKINMAALCDQRRQQRRMQCQSGMPDDEFTLRSALGEGRFAPY